MNKRDLDKAVAEHHRVAEEAYKSGSRTDANFHYTLLAALTAQGTDADSLRRSAKAERDLASKETGKDKAQRLQAAIDHEREADELDAAEAAEVEAEKAASETVCLDP